MSDKLYILIIEERESDFLRLKAVINEVEDYDATVVWKNTYEDGLESFKKEDFDICFLDSHLGKETGKDFLNELKVLKEQIPIILLGNKRNADLEKISKDDGIDDFITRQMLSSSLIKRSLRYGFDNHNKLLLLRAEEEKYSKLFYNSTEAIFTADKDYKIIEVNRSFKDLIKIQTIEEFDFRDLFIGKDYEMLFPFVGQAKKKNAKRTRIINKIGEKLEVYVSISTILSEEEEACFQGIIHDITDLEKAQVLANKAEKLSLISRMARVIGHEVRNPLTNILLATGELKDDFIDNQEATFILDMIYRNSDRISTLVDKFLENTQNTEYQKIPFVFSEIITEALENCQDRILLRKITLITNGIDCPLIVQMDKQKIIIAFTNIIINAVEALNKTEFPQLHVEVTWSEKELNVQIKDNGIGMSEEIQKNLFTPFYSSKQGGLGLGMTNVKNIVDNHNGEISIDSTLNKETTFRITFPVS